MAKSKDRDRQREARLQRIIRNFTDSGLTVREFCRRGKLRESAFYFWRRELQRREAEHLSGVALAKPEEQHTEADTPAFVPVRVERHSDAVSAAAGRIVIELSGGRRVHVTAPVDREALADVVAVLATTSPERLEGEPC